MPALIPRARADLNAHLEVLDEVFNAAPDGPDKFQSAWDSMRPDELVFAADEVYKCRTDVRYYLENYHVIKDEHGNAQSLYPLFDQQEMIYSIMQREWLANGCYRLIVLKPRQMGGTAFAGGVTFHATLFSERAFTLMMAQSRSTADELYRRIWDAYNSLPWWMRPEMESKVQGTRFVFQRNNAERRMSDPGLASTLLISNSQEQAGVAIGRTIRTLHGSEISRWPDPDVWTADIEPSMNANDTKAFLESTAYGRKGLFHNMWVAAEKGESEWTPVFIPVYRVRKYFLPLHKGDKFVLTPSESAFRARVKTKEHFTIPLGFFNWQRRKIRAKVNAKGGEEGLYSYQESYPSTSQEAFISSGMCAFPRRCLNDQRREYVINPVAIGEVNYIGAEVAPELNLHPPTEMELMDKPKRTNRFHLWEEPEPNDAIEYYIAADVSSGEAKDYSDATVYKLGYGQNAWEQVAEWHGLINPSHFARVLAALGYWYNTAEIAVEYMAAGVTTGDELRGPLDYANLYRWKHLDKTTNSLTLHLHWQTNWRTREDMITRMCEALLDRKIKIRNKFLIEEMRDFGRYEGEGRAEGIDNADDMVMANMIAIAASHQAGKGGADWGEDRMGVQGDAARLVPKTPMVYAIFNQLNQQIELVDSEAHGLELISKLEKKHNLKLPWRVVATAVNKANTIWSPIYDAQGAENELMTRHGVDPKEMKPDLVYAFRDMMTHRHYRGEEEE